MSLPVISSAARIGNFEIVSGLDLDLARPAPPPPPEPIDGEDPDAFTERGIAWRDGPLMAYTVASKAFERRLKAARETQTWADVLAPDAAPCIFVCKPIPWARWKAFVEVRLRLRTRLDVADLLVRLAVAEIRGPAFESFKVPALVEHTMIDPETNRPKRSGIGLVAPESMTEDIARRVNNRDTAIAVIIDVGEQIEQHGDSTPVP